MVVHLRGSCLVTRCNLVGDARSTTVREGRRSTSERDARRAYARRNENYCIIVYPLMCA